jgi:hypothetical protein
MKLIIHAGTGTVIPADDEVFIVDTDNLTDEENALIEYGSDSNAGEVARRAGTNLATPYANEEEALTLYYDMKQKFGWVGVIYNDEDIDNVLPEGTQIEREAMKNKIKTTRMWQKHMEDALCQEGTACLHDAMDEATEGNDQ